MVQFVKKRNGTTVPFDKQRIINAVDKAFLEVDKIIYDTNFSSDLADTIQQELNNEVSVEEIQDYVEDYLMQSNRRDVAKAYVRYRYKREVARGYNEDFLQALTEKINGSAVENQNANVDEMSFGGRVGAASDLVMKQYALDYCMSKKSRDNHLNNEIYIHDLNAYPIGMSNCLSIPFDDLLAKGFNTRQTDVRPANSVSTAFQLIAVIFQIQSLQQFGGVSATHLDWTMVPYVRKSFFKHYLDGLKYLGNDLDAYNFGLENKEDYIKKSITDECFTAIDNVYKYAIDMTEKEVRQAVEGLLHNLNTLQSRSGNQLK